MKKAYLLLGCVCAIGANDSIKADETSLNWELLQDIFKIGTGMSFTYGKNLSNTNGMRKSDPLPQILPLVFKLLRRNFWFKFKAHF